MIKNTWEGEACGVCHNEFDLLSWVDRHEENLGDDTFPDMVYYHSECCPSCDMFWNNVILTDAVAL